MVQPGENWQCPYCGHASSSGFGIARERNVDQRRKRTEHPVLIALCCKSITRPAHGQVAASAHATHRADHRLGHRRNGIVAESMPERLRGKRDPRHRSGGLRKLDEECPFQLTLPRRQLTDDTAPSWTFCYRRPASSTCTLKTSVRPTCATASRTHWTPLSFDRASSQKARHSGSRVEERPKGTKIDDSARSPASTKGRAIPKRNCLRARALLIRRLDQRARPSGDPIPRHPAPPDQKPAVSRTPADQFPSTSLSGFSFKRLKAAAAIRGPARAFTGGLSCGRNVTHPGIAH